MKTIKTAFALLLLLLNVAGMHGKTVQIRVTNPISLNRRDVVEIPLKDILQKLDVVGKTALIVRNADGDEVPSQQTTDGLLLIQTFIHPNSSETYTIEPGTPQPYRNDVCGRFYPQRADDLAWENDRNAWRVYGPALRKDNPHGIDCFTKNQPAPSLDSLYQDALLRGITYHENHGLGMDAYSVGPTLGCGAPALMQGDTLNYAVVYDKAEIQENGPLRFQALLTYYHEGGITETRQLRQDRGSHFVRCTVSYQGVKGKASVLSGLVVHKDNPDAYVISKRGRYVAYADPINSPKTCNGQLFVACLYPQKVDKMEYLPLMQETAGAVGHVVGRKAYQEGQEFAYWFGSGWSQYDVPSLTVWKSLMEDFQQMLRHPLVVE